MARFIVNAAGSIVLVGDELAAELFQRGLARPATEDEVRTWYQRHAPHLVPPQGEAHAPEHATSRSTRTKRNR